MQIHRLVFTFSDPWFSTMKREQQNHARNLANHQRTHDSSSTNCQACKELKRKLVAASNKS